MKPVYEKMSTTEIKVTKPVEEIPTVENIYSIDFLRQQEVDILRQKNDFMEARDKELLEVRTLIAKCEELDIKGTVEVKLEEEALIGSVISEVVK